MVVNGIQIIQNQTVFIVGNTMVAAVSCRVDLEESLFIAGPEFDETFISNGAD